MTTATEPVLIRVRDVELCVQPFGAPDDPPILLVAGAAASMDWWDDALCERLAAGGRRVLRYDHRDTGASSTFPPGDPPYGGDTLTEDALGLMDALGLPRAHVVGVSAGGGIAQELAIRHPERVASLTLVATSAVGGVDTDTLPGMTAELRASFEAPPPDPDWDDVDAYAEWVLAAERTFAGRIPVDDDRVRGIARRTWHRSRDVRAANNHWQIVGESGPDADPDVETIAAPTLVVHGTDDPLFPLPHGRALADAVPGARLLVVPGMGHQVPPPQTWDDVVPALLRHTSGGWGASADRLALRALAAGEPTGWFEPLYAAARRGEVPMPWDRSEGHPLLLSWLEREQPDGAGLTAVVVGCGLGADAEALAAQGFSTTAFDVSASAIAEARARHPGSAVRYVSADLLDLPPSWHEAFDLVVEIVTIQAMPVSVRERAIAAVRGLVAPGGTLLVGAAVRTDDEDPGIGPPWPLSAADLDRFAGEGFEVSSRSDAGGTGPGDRAGVRLVLRRSRP